MPALSARPNAPFDLRPLAAMLTDEDELARVYGSSSPSRIRRLLEHMERQGLIVVREEFGGGRTIIVVGLEVAESMAAPS